MDYSLISAAIQLGGVFQGEIIPPEVVLRGRYASRALASGVVPVRAGNPEAAGGLSQPHISPRAVFYLGGSLIKVSRGLKFDQVGGGLRGSVVEFSVASRRRLMYKIATVQRSVLPVFVTLTYPDVFPSDPKKWARDIDAFRKRFSRRGWGAIWKKELKPRKTGQSAGLVAPHFHMLVWGADYLELRDFCGRAWYEVVGSSDKRHLNAGVRVESVRSARGVKAYASKYLCKEDEGLADQGGGLGRFWGVINAGAIPWADEMSVAFDNQRPVFELLRLMRRFMGMKRRGSLPGLTMFCDASFWYERLGQMIT